MARNRYYAGPPSDHFDGTRFFVAGLTQDRSLADVLRWRLTSKRRPWPRRAGGTRDRPPARVDGGHLRVSFVGHASVLIQTQGLNILVDPVWAERASPFRFAGPRRVTAPGTAFDDLPRIDTVLLTHNHYDHLDGATLSRLARRDAPRLITPLGNDAILRRIDPAIAAEAVDWGARVALSDSVTIHCVAAYHWSARWLIDRRMALWCGFVVETPAGCVYHAGDTAWGDGAIFTRLRQDFPNLRLALLPIGAYEPRWFMRGQHMNPAEAVRALMVSGAREALAIHWGTFQLTDEGYDEPVAALHEALRDAAIDPERFHVLRPGGVLDRAHDTGAPETADENART